MTRKLNFTRINVGMCDLARQLGNISAAYRLVTSLRSAFSFRCETAGITEWACRGCVPLVVVGPTTARPRTVSA